LSALATLLAGVRRRLWARRLATRLALAAWPAAALLLAAGVLHAAWRDVATGFAVALAALPMALALCYGAWRDRPDATTVGRHADAWFGGDDLLLSAGDRHAATAGGFALLRERAERLATQALRDPRHWPGVAVRIHPLALVAALAGAFLLTLPGRTLPPTQDAGQRPGMAVPDTRPVAAHAPLSSPRSSPEATGETGSGERSESASATPTGAVANEVARTATPPSGMNPGITNGGRDEAGLGAGERGKEIAAAAVPLRARDLDLTGPGDSGRGAATADSRGASFASLQLSDAQAATWPGLPAGANPTPAERRYLARYFDPTLERR